MTRERPTDPVSTRNFGTGTGSGQTEPSRGAAKPPGPVAGTGAPALRSGGFTRALARGGAMLELADLVCQADARSSAAGVPDHGFAALVRSALCEPVVPGPSEAPSVMGEVVGNDLEQDEAALGRERFVLAIGGLPAATLLERIAAAVGLSAPTLAHVLQNAGALWDVEPTRVVTLAYAAGLHEARFLALIEHDLRNPAAPGGAPRPADVDAALAAYREAWRDLEDYNPPTTLRV